MRAGYRKTFSESVSGTDLFSAKLPAGSDVQNAHLKQGRQMKSGAGRYGNHAGTHGRCAEPLAGRGRQPRPVEVTLCVASYWVLSDAKTGRFGSKAALDLRKKFEKRRTE